MSICRSLRMEKWPIDQSKHQRSWQKYSQVLLRRHKLELYDPLKYPLLNRIFFCDRKVQKGELLHYFFSTLLSVVLFFSDTEYSCISNVVRERYNYCSSTRMQRFPLLTSIIIVSCDAIRTKAEEKSSLVEKATEVLSNSCPIQMNLSSVALVLSLCGREWKSSKDVFNVSRSEINDTCIQKIFRVTEAAGFSLDKRLSQILLFIHQERNKVFIRDCWE